MLTISKLEKTYENGHHAIKGVDLSIDDGEFIVLVGPSGCGKSTILRTIAGFESPTVGEISLEQRRIDTLKPATRDISMVFQNYALYPHMTVYNNLAYGLKNRGVAKADIDLRVKEVASRLKIEEYLDRKPAKLSGGQRQRVAMGRAIIRKPKLFLFDEPLSNLDASLRAHMRLEIKSLQRNLGVTSIYVTHDQVEAMTLADRIVILNQGRIEQVGTPRDVYYRPASRFVASFIGSPAMNFIPVVASQGRLLVDSYSFDYGSMPIADGEVTVGIRPEDIKWIEPSPTHNDDSIILSAKVDAVELLGQSQLLHCYFAGHKLTVMTDDRRLNPGEMITLQINKRKMYFFDQQGKACYAD